MSEDDGDEGAVWKSGDGDRDDAESMLLMTECRVDAVGGLIAIDNVCRNCPMSKNERGGILVVWLFVYLIPAVLQDLMTERLVVRAVTC
jgi:hypothetical protein